MTVTSDGSRRIVLYVQDVCGLDYLRTAYALAEALTADEPGASAMIVTASRLEHNHSLPERVDHLRLPGVKERADATYVSDALGLSIEEITSFRRDLIKCAVSGFDPHIFVVIGDPTGFRDELLDTLEHLSEFSRGNVVLTLNASALNSDPEECHLKIRRAAETIELYFDEVWVCDANRFQVDAYCKSLIASIRSRIHWTGHMSCRTPAETSPSNFSRILVTKWKRLPRSEAHRPRADHP